MKFINFIIFLLLSSIISTKSNSTENIKDLLKENGKLILIRHAYAPGTGDPDNFDILDCSTQRNLNEVGIRDSKELGAFFFKNKIDIDKVLSSEWCRCKDTAYYAFKDYEKKKFLNSFYSEKFAHKKKLQIDELKKYIKKWKEKKNVILVTHYVVIYELLNVSASPGEIIIADKNFKFLARYNVLKK